MTTPPPMAATWDLLDQISLELDQVGAWTAMHELSIGHAVPQRLRGLVAPPDAIAIGRLTLRIGPLEAVELNKLRCTFPLVAAGASCEDSSHEIQQIAAEIGRRISLRPLSSDAVM